MRVLVACEFSGIVRDAFAARGADAWSCDLLESERPGNHFQCDVFDAFRVGPWDLIILHPPCTALTVSGNRHYADTKVRSDAVAWTRDLFELAVCESPRVALENPVGVLSSAWRKPDQYIQPWQFGHGETKKTGLWLHGLPLLKPADIVEGRADRIHKMPPGPDRWKDRSRTYPGIAEAMADQWGAL